MHVKFPDVDVHIDTYSLSLSPAAERLQVNNDNPVDLRTCHNGFSLSTVLLSLSSVTSH